MVTRSPEVDAYIESAVEFAQPILVWIRSAFHRGCPSAVETIKWGVPHFEYRGILGGMAAFKRHVAFGFWKAQLMSDPAGLLPASRPASMCSIRIERRADLPTKAIVVDYVREAARLNREGATLPKKARGAIVDLPPEFASALSRHRRAREVFDGMSDSHRREYVDWIAEAKRDATRSRRVATAIEWLAEGKPRNWKYLPKR